MGFSQHALGNHRNPLFTIHCLFYMGKTSKDCIKQNARSTNYNELQLKRHSVLVQPTLARINDVWIFANKQTAQKIKCTLSKLI